MATTIATRITATTTDQRSQHAPSSSLHLISPSVETPTQQPRRQDSLIATTLKDGLCHFALYILHIVCLIYTACCALRKYINYQISSSSLYSNHQTVRSQIRHDKAQLTKIPQHLSFLLSQELASERTAQEWEMLIHDICLATCWAWEFGIKEVSVFDASGELHAMSMDIYKQQYNTLLQWIKSSSSSLSSLDSDNDSKIMPCKVFEREGETPKQLGRIHHLLAFFLFQPSNLELLHLKTVDLNWPKSRKTLQTI